MIQPTLLVTRPHSDAERFVRAVETKLGRQVPHVIAPLLKIVPLDPQLPPCSGLVLTSRHGAKAAARLGLSRSLPAYCVGTATAAAAEEAGFKATGLGGTADALVEALLGDPPEGPLLHLHGVQTRGNVAARLTAGGINTADREVYEQAQCPPSRAAVALLKGSDPVVAPVFSPRSARLLAHMLPPGSAPVIVAISPAAAAIFGGRKLSVWTADAPDLASMINLTARQLATPDQSRGSA